jgi:hypothetical protein
MLGLDSVRFDTSGFELSEPEIVRSQTERLRAWQSAEGDGVGLFFFSMPPDLAGSLDDLASIRQQYRLGGAALIEVEKVTLDGCDGLRTIVKIPQAPRGMTYIGGLTLPFRDCSWVLKAQCQEHGTTGVREAIVLDERVDDVKLPSLEGWQGDPYDPALRAPLQRNLSDAAEYDAQFPDHPLSRLRRLLPRLSGTFHVVDEVRALPPFPGPQARPRRKWWHF